MDQEMIGLEVERCEREAELAKKAGNFELAFMKLDNARRLRDKINKTTTEKTISVGGAST